MRVAIFIDGAFFIKRVRHFEPQHTYNAKRMADLAFSMAIAHLNPKKKAQNDELYRIFFYDCPPLEKKMHNPITKKAVDFGQSQEAIFRKKLHQEIIKKRKFALRLGKLSDTSVAWHIKPAVQQLLLKNKKAWHELDENDVAINVSQKGVDMRIGLDIASVTLKKQVDKIILISGDSDFVPASKLARREGMEFVLDPMWQKIPDDLFEHIDGLTSTYVRKVLSDNSPLTP